MSYLQNFIKDWGGFEKLVADLNATGEVKVQRDVKLIGKDGVERQIDVLISHKQGIYNHKILVECKYWGQRVKRAQIDAMIKSVEDLGASKGVFFTTKGYQSGAKIVAEKNNIDLFVVREPSDDEWGAPGRKVNLTLQVISIAPHKIQMPNPMLTFPLNKEFSQKDGQSLKIHLGPGEEMTQTKTVYDDGAEAGTLEDAITKAANDAVKTFFDSKNFILNSGKTGTNYISQGVDLQFKKTRNIVLKNASVQLPSIKFDVGIKVQQSAINIDRLDNYFYALIVEDCVSKLDYIASKKKTEEISVLKEKQKQENNTEEDVLKNGSVIRVFTKGWFDPKELEGLNSVSWDELKIKKNK